MGDKSESKNPFEEVEKAAADAIKRQLEIVRELDEMEADVTPWEANFLENVLRQLRDRKRPLTQEQLEVVYQMCNRYEVDYDDLTDGRK